MRVNIHRGTKEIGGTCIELEASGERLLLDLGLPLDGDPDDIADYPALDGLDGQGSLRALVLSHGHLDHWGLAHLAGDDLPVALGAVTHRIFKAAAPFIPRPYVPQNTVELRDRTPLTFGPFKVTPYLVDHSAYDAYALEVEAGGQKLFYSGDFRAHGRKAALFEKLIANPPVDIDVLLMEGSTLGRLDAEHKFLTEAEIETRFVDVLQAAPGMALIAASAQNIDRMVSLYRACKKTGRTLIIDLYAAEVLRATGNANIPQSDWPNMAVHVPHYQRVRIKKTERFDILESHRANRIFAEDLKTLAPKAAFLFRPAMLPDLDRAECLNTAVAVWSQWEGYLKQEKGARLSELLKVRGIPLEYAHTSGHASISDLKRLALAVAPRMLVPIHTFEPHRFPEYFGTIVHQKNDGEWWEIAA
jgi:ribonuclease J